MTSFLKQHDNLNITINLIFFSAFVVCFTKNRMLDKLGILAFKKHIIVVLCFERQDSSNHVQFFACGQETKHLNTRTYIYDEMLVRSLSFIVSNTAHVVFTINYYLES